MGDEMHGLGPDNGNAAAERMNDQITGFTGDDQSDSSVSRSWRDHQNAVSFNGLILLVIRHVVLDVLSKVFASIKSGVSSPSLNLSYIFSSRLLTFDVFLRLDITRAQL